MGENFESIMDAYFENFKENIESSLRISNKHVDDYEKDIWFLGDYDKVLLAVRLGIKWLKPLAYEVNIDDIRDIVEEIINDLMDPKDTYFGTYDEFKTRVSLDI